MTYQHNMQTVITNYLYIIHFHITYFFTIESLLCGVDVLLSVFDVFGFSSYPAIQYKLVVLHLHHRIYPVFTIHTNMSTLD